MRDECGNERERPNSEGKKVAKLKTEDYNTNVFDKCFNLAEAMLALSGLFTERGDFNKN